ncbi:D-alanine--D-alanine ligase [Candidatus Saccharibacteria bacterium]|nr:D-alanine--D-alanine ligase [Candidatus Saccharibacteria bacterium]
MEKIRLGVLIGGPSREHEVSKLTAANVLSVIDSDRYEIIPILVDMHRHWHLYQGIEQYAQNNPSAVIVHHDIVQQLPYLIDVALIAMHGEFGEDGEVQRLLDRSSIPYQGSGPRSSALAFNKHRSSELLKRMGIAVPDYTALTRANWVSARSAWINRIARAYKWPVVVKPNAAGSSVGVTLAFTPAQLADAIESVSVEHELTIIQRYIRGTEVTCAVLEGKNGPIALPPTLIRPLKARFFDFSSKYEAGASEEITPAPLPPNIIKHIQATAVRVHRVLGCRDYSRVDMILGQGRIWVLELNSLPGMTDTSLLPQAAAVMGISFTNLVSHLLTRAQARPEVVELSTYEYNRTP